MGLAERRASMQFQSEQFPKLKKEVDVAAGFEVPLEVDWDTLPTDGETHLYNDSWTRVYFHPLRDAFKDICIDKGVLTLDHKPTTNVDDVKDRAEGIRKTLEEKL
ncbi:MAG: hypothetical protein H0W83_03615 [Planctomycetes bacterium]|nr:hypothetical protein [Planctomycetota bacterium]